MQQRYTMASAEQNIFCRESCNICDNEFQTLLPDPQIVVLGHYAPGGYNATAIVSVGGVAPCVRENHGRVTAIVCKQKSL